MGAGTRTRPLGGGGPHHGLTLGSADPFDRAMARFAAAYADTNDADHAQLAAAVADGTLDAVIEAPVT